MFSTGRNCFKRIARGAKSLHLQKSKAQKTKTETLPIFQYPISQKDEHRVYVWGLAHHGALGENSVLREKKISYAKRPKRLSFAEQYKVMDIACGYGFTTYAVHSSDKNIVYGTGINTDSQLGFNKMDKKFPDNMVFLPRPINLPLQDNKTKVLDMAAGRAHLLILTTEGLFTLGNNAYGQCGRPIIMNENYEKSAVIHHIPDIKGHKITTVTAGQDHSMLLTEVGEVYTFGWGADGQTGLAHFQNEHQPSLVKGDLAGQRIIKVACVADCVLALSDKGKVFGWGNSEYEQLPVKNNTYQINIATELDGFQDLGHIVDIAAGGCFCMVLNDAGNVYVWGYGILGLGPEVEKISKPTQIPPALFGKNIYNRDTKVTKINCGISQLAALTNSGDLFMWGVNKYGCLGLGHEKDQFFPLRVSVGAQVKKVACGIDHTVALCKPFI